MAIFSPTDFTITTIAGQRFISLAGGGGGSLTWYNVRDYGALGDDSTDDYAAFIAARNAIWAAGVAAVLYIPPGIYRSSNFVQLQSQANRPPIYVMGEWCVLRSTTDTSFFYRKWDDSSDFTEVVQLVIDGCFFLPTVSGSSTGVHTVDSWGTIVRRCHFKNLKIGMHVQAVNSWNEGWVSEDNIFDNCTAGFDFNNAGGTGSFQSGRMTDTVIRVLAGQKGIKIQNGANMYGSHFEFNIWVGGNSAIALSIDGNVHSCRFIGIVDTAGASGTPLYGIEFGTNATNTDHAQFSIDFAGTYTGGDAQANAVHNAFSKTWYYDPLPHGSRLYPRYTLLSATGDTPYASAANTWARRAIGSAGDISKVAGGLPTWAAPAALTKVDDTNVTATLGGSASTGMVNAASITLGWTGTLAVSRGGIGVGTLASNGVLYGNGTGAVLALAVNATATNKYLQQTSSGAPVWATIPASEITSGAALTKTDDTNVTATLGGSPTTALLAAASITLGWTGTLSQARGGTGSATPFANPSASVGLAAVNGAATTFMRSDAAPALSQAITPTWTGLHIWDQVGVRIQGTGGYFSAGVTGAPQHVTAGDGTFTRLWVGDALGGLGANKAQFYSPAYAPGGAEMEVVISQTIQPAAAVAYSVGMLYLDGHLQPQGAAGLTSAWTGVKIGMTHDSGARTIASIQGVDSTVSQNVAASTTSSMTGVRGAVSGLDGTITLGAGGSFGVNATGGTVTTGVGVDIANGRTSGTFTTSIGLRINAATGTIGTDIAIQSLGGQNRFVGSVQIGQDTAPSVELSVFAGTTPRIHLHSTSSGSTSADGFQLALSTADAYAWNFENGPMHIATNNTERITIAAAGTVSVALDSRLIGAVTVGANAGATSGYSFDVQALRARFAPAFTTTTSLDAAVYVAPTITNNTTANIAQFHIGGAMVGDADSPIGFLLRPFFNPSSSITEAFGGSLAAVHNGGTISGDMVGFRAIVGSFVSTGALSGSITGIRVDTPVYLGTVKAVTVYGIRIQNQGLSGQTTSVGLYINAQSGSTNNYTMGFGAADLTAGVGAIYGRIPILYNGILRYLRVYPD